MHPRACVSAISTFNLALDEDLAFWERHTSTRSACRWRSSSGSAGTREPSSSPTRSARGLRVANLIGLGPFNLADPASWPKQQDRLVHSIDTAAAVGAECMVFTTGPFAPLTWEDAADSLESRARARCSRRRKARGIPFAIEHTNSLRVDVGFVHTLQDAIDLARRFDVGVCMELNACWAERALAADDPRRHRSHPARAGERLQGRHRRVVAAARARRRRHPDRADPRRRARRRLRRRVRPRADRRRDRRRGLRRRRAPRGRRARLAARRRSAPDREPPIAGGPHSAGGRRGPIGISRPSISATRAK